MFTVQRMVDWINLGEYGNHLKRLSDNDRRSRFGAMTNDTGIDNLILNMAYHPDNHRLWFASDNKQIFGWGHLAKQGNSWELAVSVESEYQRKGVANRLIGEMLEWAKFHHVDQVFMHCIEENKAIQHLAFKHNLKTKERGYGERTAAIEVPEPTFLETNNSMMKEQSEILQDMAKLRMKLANLWMVPLMHKE
jgi:GNAT superfamily N-acetyltransferase